MMPLSSTNVSASNLSPHASHVQIIAHLRIAPLRIASRQPRRLVPPRQDPAIGASLDGVGGMLSQRALSEGAARSWVQRPQGAVRV